MFRQVFGLRGETRWSPRLRLPVRKHSACIAAGSVRSPIPLRDSPGFSPGSLFPRALYVVVEPKTRHKIKQEKEYYNFYFFVWREERGQERVPIFLHWPSLADCADKLNFQFKILCLKSTQILNVNLECEVGQASLNFLTT